MNRIVLQGAALLLAMMAATAAAQTLEELEARLKREQAAEAAQQAEAQRKANAAQQAAAVRKAAEAAMGTMIIKADHDCALSVNGESKGQLVAEQTTTVKVNAGEQLIECVGERRARAEVTERIPAGEQKVVRLTVSGGERFEQVADGVQDYEQGVVWAASDNGSNINWPSAGQYCAAKGGGWTLPTSAQLQSLYDSSGTYGRSWTGLSGNTYTIKFATPLIQWSSCCFWSAESNGSSEAWGVHLGNGDRFSNGVSFAFDDRALCVRRP